MQRENRKEGGSPDFLSDFSSSPFLMVVPLLNAHDEAGKRVRLPTKGQIKWISKKQKTNLIKANQSIYKQNKADKKENPKESEHIAILSHLCYMHNK